MFAIRFCFFFIAILICSCKSNYRISEVDPNFVKMINENKNLDTANINFAGFYNNYTLMGDCAGKASSFCVVSPILFYKNGLVFQTKVLSDDSLQFSMLLSHTNVKGGIGSWGTFNVTNDTVKAIIYSDHPKNKSQILHYVPCYYQGVVKDSGTISDWKLVQPFPEINKKFEPNFLENETKPHLLVFQKFPSKTKVDSNNIWINEYRKH